MLTDELKNLHAVWYDSTNPSRRCLAVRLSNGRLTVTQRDKPSDVWSPPKPMFLTGFTNTYDKIPDNPDLVRDMERGK